MVVFGDVRESESASNVGLLGIGICEENDTADLRQEFHPTV